MKNYKVCPTCGKKFTKNYYYSKKYWNKQVYCSLKCSGTLFIKTSNKHRCFSCKKEIWVWPSREKRNKTGKFFCSRKCADKEVGKLKIGFHHTEETKKKIRERRALQKPISPEAYAKRKLSGTNHWNWKGGITREAKYWRGKKWKKIRLAVYKRDNYICQKCGVKCSGKPGKKLIQCHHIKPWKMSKDNSMENLITLCLSCHIKEDFRFDKKMRDIKQSGGF